MSPKLSLDSPSVPSAGADRISAHNLRRTQVRAVLKCVQAAAMTPETPSLARSIRSKVDQSESDVDDLLNGSDEVREELLAEYRSH